MDFKKEGNKIVDNLEETSSSVEPKVELNSDPVPVSDSPDENETDDLNENVGPEETTNLQSTQPTTSEENLNADEEVEDLTASGPNEEYPGVKTYTQEDLNDIAGKTRRETREKTFRYIYDRYGVQDEAGLDDLVGNAQRYDSLQEKYQTEKSDWEKQSSLRDKELADIKEQVALMQSGIDSDRYDDAKLILKGKGLEVSLENINEALSTHPEWKKENLMSKSEGDMDHPYVKVDESKPEVNQAPVSKISVLGNESTSAQGKNNSFEDEEARAMRLFKV